jgi:hypothetical protein
MMDYIIDPEGDLLLSLVECPEKIHLELLRAGNFACLDLKNVEHTSLYG